jgi:hypothetical protein
MYVYWCCTFLVAFEVQEEHQEPHFIREKLRRPEPDVYEKHKFCLQLVHSKSVSQCFFRVGEYRSRLESEGNRMGKRKV